MLGGGLSSNLVKKINEVGVVLLKYIDIWRKHLATDLVFRNSGISDFDLNNVIWRVINGLIFLKFIEDKDIKKSDNLLKMSKFGNIYNMLNKLFVKINILSKDYEEDIVVDNKILVYIIKSLYCLKYPRIFSFLSVELLGGIYEFFLGRRISFERSVDSGKCVVKVEKDVGVKKFSGIFYTPRFIVDFIVDYVVGGRIKGLEPGEVLKLRVCDPACGCGYFLISVYQYLMDYFLDYYTRDDKVRECALKDNKICVCGDGGYKLSFEVKKDILLNVIYGVDIDYRAVEVTKLLLYLKLFEGEDDVFNSYFGGFGSLNFELLPSLDNNIKCGDSLLSGKNSKFNGIVNSFNWEGEFECVFKGGGFDVIVGNPPYIQLQNSFRDGVNYADLYEGEGFEVFDRMGDIYCLFYEKGLRILKDGGVLGFITSNKWMRAWYGVGLRNFFLKFNPKLLIDLGADVFKGAKVDSSVFIIEKSVNKNELRGFSFKKNDIKYNKNIKDIINGKLIFLDKSVLGGSWYIGDELKYKVKEKIESGGMILKNWGIRIYRGVMTGLDEVFVINDKVRDEILSGCRDDEERMNVDLIIRPILRGRNISRYSYKWNGLWVILLLKGFDVSKVPSVLKYLEGFRGKLEARSSSNKWYELGSSCSFFLDFKMDKVGWQVIAGRPSFCIVDSDFYLLSSAAFFVSDDSNNLKYLMGVLNSRLVYFYIKMIVPDYGKRSLSLLNKFVGLVPIPVINENNLDKVKEIIDLVNKIIYYYDLLKKEGLCGDERLEVERNISDLDKMIDRIVYNLYNLNEDEIKIIEREV